MYRYKNATELMTKNSMKKGTESPFRLFFQVFVLPLLPICAILLMMVSVVNKNVLPERT